MTSHRRRRRRTEQKTTEPVPSSLPYEVSFTDAAFEVYDKLHQNMVDAEKQGKVASEHHTKFRMVEEAIKKIIPADPINKKYGLSGPLSQFFRTKKGRMRICWAASSAKRAVCILFISETLRKEGDVNDPYNIFTKLVMSGAYHDILNQMVGVTPARIGDYASAPTVN